MLCQNCGVNEATTKMKIKTNYGKIIEIQVCEDCAKLDNAFMVEFGDTVWGNPGNKVAIVCPTCKTDLDDYLETNFVGCKDCYTSFNEEVERGIYNIHGSVKHTGKVPEFQLNKENRKVQLSKLSKELEEAVKTEDFDRAKMLKIKIDELKGGR